MQSNYIIMQFACLVTQIFVNNKPLRFFSLIYEASIGYTTT